MDDVNGSRFPTWYHDTMAVIPGYRDLFGTRKSLEELITLIKRYPVAEWFCFLSRLQTMLAPPHHFNTEHHEAVIGGVLTRGMRERRDAWRSRLDPRARVFGFAEPQISTLQQLVLMYAPMHGGRTFGPPDDYDDLVTALLITWDLMLPDDELGSEEAVLARVMQLHTWTPTESAHELATRAFHMYRLASDSPPPAIAEIRRLFELATAVRMQEFLTGGMAVAIREYARSPQEIAEGWLTTPLAEQCENPEEARCLKAFHRVRCGTLEQVCSAVKEFDGDRLPNNFSLIGLYRFPIVDIPDRGRFVTNLAALSNALMAGIRFTLLDAVRDGRLPEMTPQRLNGIWGSVFEEYVVELLGSAFGQRLIRLRKSERTERADCLVVYPDKVLVIEIKGSHTKGTVRRGNLTLTDREAELRKLRIPKAASQLATTIKDLCSSEIEDERLLSYDWTTTQIIPVVVTFERLPLMRKLWPIYERVTNAIAAVPLREQIAPVRFLSIDDIEDLPDLAQTVELGSVLLRWAYDNVARERPLGEYLQQHNIQGSGELRAARIRRMLEFLAEEIGLDARSFVEVNGE